MQADFVIVGAGSAGSALASRLSEDGRNTVIVIEHGGGDAGPLIQMPAALSYPMNMRRYDWGYRTEPEPHLGNRRLAAPRGKVIGGSSSINGMVYVRGHALDYDGWAAGGADGWAFADVLGYFKRMEAAHGDRDGGWRGMNGPVHVRHGDCRNPLARAFIAAGAESGFGNTDDINGARQEGLGPLDQTIHRGRRWSTANAYLKPALKRANLRLVRGLAERIVIRDGRATGVRVRRHGRAWTARANREVIVAASAFNSPKLLMLSGIGPAEHLRGLGIDVAADRPGVGANLQDHLEVYLQWRCLRPVSLYPRTNPVSKALVGAQWLLFGTGAGASNHFEAAAFVRSRAGVRYPDVQCHLLPLAIRYDGRLPVRGHGFQVHVGPMRSPSRGSVTLRSPDPAAAPVIRFNYMSEPQDWTDFRRCIRTVREIVGQRAFDGLRGDEIAPGSRTRTDAELDAFVRDHAESAYHPCGTCRMGRAGDRASVVDPECRVIGIDGLRVADSSIFPLITNGNLNAPSMMVGEKASDHILGRPPLSRSNLRPWINPRWETSDR